MGDEGGWSVLSGNRKKTDMCKETNMMENRQKAQWQTKFHEMKPRNVLRIKSLSVNLVYPSPKL